MEKDIVTRKVAQDVLMFVWYKQKILVRKPNPELGFAPDITVEFMNDLCISVLVYSYCNEFIYAKYFGNHFKCMTNSPYLFAKHVYHACYIFNKGITDAYESFLGTLSLMSQFVFYCWQRGRKEFSNTCVELFCAFFEKEIRTKFEEQGSWRNFNAYLVENHENLQMWKKLIEIDYPLVELFQQVRDANRKRDEPQVIGDFDLKDITEKQVEENPEAIDFADSVLRKMQQLCKQTLTEVIEDFTETDIQLLGLYRKMVEKAFNAKPSSLQKDQEDVDVKASEGEQFASNKNQEEIDAETGNKQTCLQKDQEEIDENGSKEKETSLQKDPETFHGTSNKVVQSSSQGVRDKDKNDSLEIPCSDLSKSQDFDPASQESDPNAKLTKEEKTKILLRDLLVDFEKLFKLVDSIDVKIPKREM